MAEDLGTRLMRAGLMTRARLAEVRSAPHGGALVRALAAGGLSQDAIAGFFVAEGFGPLLEPRDLTDVEPAALARLPGAMAHELLALPLRRSPVGLIVAMAAPSDAHSVAEIERAIGGPILPSVARLDNLVAALELYYQRTTLPNDVRDEQPVLELVKPKQKPPEPGYAGSTRGTDRVEARATLGPRLVADDGETAVPLVRQKPAVTPDVAFTRKVITRTFELPSKLAPAPKKPIAPARPRSIIPPEHEQWDSPTAGPSNKVDKKRLSPAVAESPRRLPQLGEQLAAMRRSKDRDEVVQLACRAAAMLAQSALLLALKKDVLRGWDGWGGTLSRDAVRNLWVPTKSPSSFREVLTTKAIRRGPLGHSAADALFRAAIGSRGGEMLLCPILVSGRVVAVLAADELRFGDAGASRLEQLGRAVGEAFERIIVEGKGR